MTNLLLVKGDWVLVNYDGNLYPGEVTKTTVTTVTVSAMEKLQTSVEKNLWRWPTRPDVHDYPHSDINRKIHPPIPTGNRASQFLFSDCF